MAPRPHHDTIRCNTCDKWCEIHPLQLKWHWCGECETHIIHDQLAQHRADHRAARATNAPMAPGEYQEMYGS